MNSYWSESAALAPYCIALPGSAEDASTIMKVIVKNDCQFGIRGGGHGSFPLSNSISDGITIDLGKYPSLFHQTPIIMCGHQAMTNLSRLHEQNGLR